MKTIEAKKYAYGMSISIITGLVLALLIWWLIKTITIDPGIVQVILIAFATWLVLLKITFNIAYKFLSKITSTLQDLSGNNRKLTSWQQHVLYLAVSALLVLSGTGCLIAIC